ncbi:uncharacterized protein C8R40DRAFT_1074735 [Lentinula edodes]|uniref:uncharacterized protein n=1 Tax=Lentinula edodes TaxID=5353 RepID=UPI001E8D72D6|nr:uncharacterized protein C8R40DRAFT_1074735 [Lentinula edodes]KAH7868512.1 hypothetical protein C8R40DRAFT_1074735 [Lentinula edodes]
MPKSLCDQTTCQYPFVGSNTESHRKEYHSTEHKLLYNGIKVKVSRQPEGKLPCPCGSERHARYSFKKLTALTRLPQHPLPDESPHPDHDIAGSNTSPTSLSSLPTTSSLSVSLATVAASLASTSHSDPSTLSTSASLLACDVEDEKDVEMEEGDAPERAGDLMSEDVFEKVDGGEDEEERGGVGDDFTSAGGASEDDQGSDKGSEYEDEPPESTNGENDMEGLHADDDLALVDAEIPKSEQQALNYLARFNIIVEPAYRLTICTECNKPTLFAHVRSHQWEKHYKGLVLPSELRLPSKYELRQCLVLLGADQPRPVPQHPISRIQGIEIADGFKCAVLGCVNAVFGSSRSLRRHQLEVHTNVQPGDRKSVRVPCQPLSVFRKDLRYVEVVPEPQYKSLVLRSIEQAADSCKLLEHSDIFSVTSNEREKNAVFAQTRWDQLLEGVNITHLRQSISTPERHSFQSFERLRAVAREYYEEVSKKLPNLPILVRSDLKHKPFRRPQELKTVIEDAHRTAQFVAFLITTNKTPVDSFPVPLHSSLRTQLKTFTKELEDENSTISHLKDTFHESVWMILSRPSDEYIRNELMCPFTRFLIAVNLKDSGAFVRASVIPPIIAQPQWCFRATAAEQILRIQDQFNGDPMMAYTSSVQRFIIDTHSVLFTTLRQNMNLFRAIATRQQGLARFNWNIERSVISIDGFPIPVSSFVDGVHRTLKDVKLSIERVFRGCPYVDILKHIDEAMVPHQTGQPMWFRDRPGNSDIRYSFFEERENGFEEFRPRLLDHLSRDPKFFTTVGDRTIPKNAVLGAILAWFSELDEVVRKLYYLISTTWGGGSRGTEIERLLYANNPRNTRNVFVINGLLTIVTEYQKTQSLTGAGKLIARSPAFHVNRLLILVLGVVYWAAGFIGCRVGMEKANCQRYFYEVFVVTGKPMESKDFSKVLGSLNGVNLGVDLKLQDFRQLMACMLISSTSTSFFNPNDEDPNVVAAHESFGHSLDMGRSNYGLDSTSTTGLAADAVAHMQQVCLKWQVFLNLLHPLLEVKLSREPQAVMTNSSNSNALISSHFQSLVREISERFDGFEQRTRTFIRSEIETMGIQLLAQISNSKEIPSYHNPHRPSVHPAARQALKAVLRRKYNPLLGFTSAEQAELVNSVGSSLHVFGIIETGGGKSLAFFGAPFLFPRHLFVVVSPLVALTQDLRRRLLETGINGGVWNEDLIDIHIAQLILVSAHKAGTDEFHGWLTSHGVKLRLKRIFVDEAHKIATDDKFRSCFRRFSYLTRSSVPITFLSGSLMPKSMPKILDTMGIKDPALVDEIRRYSGRPNLKYIVEKVDEEEAIQKILDFVQAETLRMGPEDRGIIFTRTRKDADLISEALDVPKYLGGMSTEERKEAENRWRKRANPRDLWIVATQAFGQGVDYPHVRRVIHLDPMDLLDYFQETSRSGRDGLPAVCHCYFSKLPPPLADHNEVDHSGRGDMILFLQTVHCLRMAFACFDRITHSCIALNGELCSNCEKLQEVPYEFTTLDLPRFDKTFVTETPTSTSTSGPSTAESNAAILNASYDAGTQQLIKFTKILESVIFGHFAIIAGFPFDLLATILPLLPTKSSTQGAAFISLMMELQGILSLLFPL